MAIRRGRQNVPTNNKRFSLYFTSAAPLEPTRLDILPLYQWTTEDIIEWMKDLQKSNKNIKIYPKQFKKHKITGRELLVLDANELQRMNITDEKFISEMKKLQISGKYITFNMRARMLGAFCE